MSVKCIETGEVYYSTYSAAEACGISVSSVSRVCRGETEMCIGLHFINTDDPVTYKKRKCCVCGTVFTTKGMRTTWCSKKCKEQIKRKAKRASVKKPIDREFTLDTKRMMVRFLEKGQTIAEFANDARRSVESIIAECARMKSSGEWDEIKRFLDMDYELTRYEASSRIA